jgi:hypothetical protein
LNDEPLTQAVDWFDQLPKLVLVHYSAGIGHGEAVVWWLRCRGEDAVLHAPNIG